jgi:carboxyl-terminal processing protease
MRISWFRKAAVYAADACLVPAPASAQQADFNEVGRQMAIMLQNSHFARLPFNEELSAGFWTIT